MTLKENKIIIDAAGYTLGRLATFAAKSALEGKDVIIFNAEQVLISGNRASIFKKYRKIYAAKSMTNPIRIGPKRPRNSDRFVRRSIRGMLPWNKTRGREAYTKIMVYIGKPDREIMKVHHIDISKANITEVEGAKVHHDLFVTVAELCKELGGKDEQ